MTDGVRYTREQRENTIAGISLIREAHAGGTEYAAEDTLRDVVEHLKQWREPSTEDGLARLVTGAVNAGAILLDWIEAEANNKRILLEKVRKSLPDFEEPDDYATNAAWSSAPGVLLAIEKTVRETPLSD